MFRMTLRLKNADDLLAAEELPLRVSLQRHKKLGSEKQGLGWVHLGFRV